MSDGCQFQSSTCTRFLFVVTEFMRGPQAGVIQAITPISMKLSQTEGYTRQPAKTAGLALGLFSRYLHHPSPLVFGAKILKIEPKLASKSEKPLDHRIQTILL